MLPVRKSTDQPYVCLHRRTSEPAALRPRKQEKLLGNIASTLDRKCCSGRCLRKVTYDDIEALRLQNLAKFESEVTEWLGGKLAAYLRGDRIEYRLQDLRVCRKAWRLAHGVSDAKLRLARRLALDGSTKVVRAMRISEAPQKAKAITFLQLWLEKECDPVVSGQ